MGDTTDTQDTTVQSEAGLLERAGTQLYVDQIMQLGVAAEQIPVEAYDAVIEVLEGLVRRARLQGVSDTDLQRTEGQIEVVKAVRKLNRALHDAATRLRARQAIVGT